MRSGLYRVAVLSFLATALWTFTPALFAQKSDSSKGSDSSAEKQGNKNEALAWMGVGVEPVHPGMRSHLPGLQRSRQGLLVVDVADNSPAEKAGIKPDDILMTFDDQRLFSPEQLAALVHGDKPGKEAKLTIIRAGKSENISVTLGSHPMDQYSGNPRRMRRGNEQNAEPAWTRFDSLTLNRTGKDKYKVQIGYETEGGKIEHQTFEGTREEIKQDILAQKDMPKQERQDLLSALRMSDQDNDFMPPAFFFPDRNAFRDFDGGDF
jgi:membrane-associated protease RseP (regulator of RpoE activity)